jgi:uncharacterized delta-60 repeat protein
MNPFARLSSAIRSVLSIVAAVLTIGVTHASIDYPGDVDQSYGNFTQNYFSVVALGQMQGSGGAVAILPDGKRLIAGTCTNASATQATICVGRLNADGSVDGTFGTNGAVVLSRPSYTQSFGSDIAVLPDGRIYITGVCTDSVGTQTACLFRMLADGSPDTSFQLTGKTQSTFFQRALLTVKLLVQNDGKPLLAASCAGNAICMARFLTDGFPDTSFGVGQVILLDGTSNGFGGIVEQVDGSLLLAGQCIVPSSFRVCVQRLLPNGTLDTTFAGGNVILTSQRSGARGIALQPDGKSVVLGACFDGSINRFCVFRLNADGTIDASFGSTAGASFSISAFENQPSAIRMQPDGKVIVVGSCRASSTPSDLTFCVARLTQDGRADNGFSLPLAGGRAMIQNPGFPLVNSPTLTLQPDGKAVLATPCGLGSCTVRLLGGPFGAKQCSLDVDGDNIPATSNDILLVTRASMGFTGSAVVQGATFASHASRTSWTAIRDYLVSQCGMSLSP